MGFDNCIIRFDLGKIINSWPTCDDCLFRSKITRYSPSEVNKAYDKAMQRKTVPIFDPQSTIELIRSGEEIQATLDENGKRQLIDRYFEVSEKFYNQKCFCFDYCD